MSKKVEEIAAAAVQEIARLNTKSKIIQTWYRARLHKIFFSRIFTKRIRLFQGQVRTFFTRKRYLELLEQRRPWKDLLRPNEAIVLTSAVIKTSDVRGVRTISKAGGPLKSLLSSKKQRQLILTTGEVSMEGDDDSSSPPRLFYVDPVTRTWKGDIPFDLQLICGLTLSEKEFLIFSRQNEEKMDKDPVWSFLCTGNETSMDWIQQVRKPVSIVDLVTKKRFSSSPSTSRALSPSSKLSNNSFASTSSNSSSSRRLNHSSNNNGSFRLRPAKDLLMRTTAELTGLSTSKLLVNRLRVGNIDDDCSIKGPLLMRQLVGPKKYFQHYFCMKGSDLFWMEPPTTSTTSDDEIVPTGGLTLTPTCRVRFLETPRILPNLPNVAFWIYVPGRNKPIKFRTLDLETAQKWVEQIGLAIARCEVESSTKNDHIAIANLVFQTGKSLFEDRQFLKAKLKFKDALDICYSNDNNNAALDYEGKRKIEFDCLEYRSRCNFMLRLYERALDDSTKALNLFEDDESCLRTRAACLERLNRFDESLMEYDKIMRKFPDSTQDLKEVKERVLNSMEQFTRTDRTTPLKSSKPPAIARQTLSSTEWAEQSSGIFLFNSEEEFEDSPKQNPHQTSIPKRRFDIDKKSSFNSKRFPSSMSEGSAGGGYSSPLSDSETGSFRIGKRMSTTTPGTLSPGNRAFSAAAEQEIAISISRRSLRRSVLSNENLADLRREFDSNTSSGLEDY